MKENLSNNHTDAHSSAAPTGKNSHPPRFWSAPEELDPKYWQDPKNIEKRGQEFFEKPIETLDRLDRTQAGSMARRDFLTIMGASAAMASLSCARRPVNKIIPYVVQPEQSTPGVATWYASTCRGCSVGCGILTKNRERRPIKIEGNPDHPVNAGKTCSKGQASLLDLYDPGRLKAPVRLTPGQENSAQALTWSELDKSLSQLLKGKAAGQIRILSGVNSSPSARLLVGEFLKATGQSESSWVEFEMADQTASVISQSREICFGDARVPVYQFDKAKVVVSVGADYLAQWLDPIHYAGQWAKNRKLQGSHHARATMSETYTFESNVTVTGSNSDFRYAIRPGDELGLVYALLNSLQKNGASISADLKSIVQNFSAATVAKKIGGHFDGALIDQLAASLWRNRGESLVVAGGMSSHTSDALALQIAVNALNSALENEGSTILASAGKAPGGSSLVALRDLAADMNRGEVEVLILDGVNPAYMLPGWKEFLDGLKKVKTVIVHADRIDETAIHGHYVLAKNHYLESWGDHESRPGLVSLQQPAIFPLHQTRSFEENLIHWMRAMGSTGMPKSFHEYLKQNWKKNYFASHGKGQSFDRFWVESLKAGVIGSASSKRESIRGQVRGEAFVHLKGAKGLSQVGPSELALALYQKGGMGDGSQANNGWIQELPDAISTATWDNYVLLAPSKAHELKLHTHDVVKVMMGPISMMLPVVIQPGMHAAAAAIAVGYGRTRAGKVGNGVGKNAFEFVTWLKDRMVFSGSGVTLEKVGRRYEVALTQMHHRTEHRPVLNDVTLSDYRKNPHAEAHTNPHLRPPHMKTIWPKFEYKGYRWGMSIDLNSCTGCGSCVVACQAENNIPVVGRDRVREGREMHWIRIDRYFSGPEEDPDFVFQPMLCQHCENASCETVCPVLATVHSDEGLNDMAYNRCVGTRYCQNNCPYKVRRFNFFDHWKAVEGEQNLAWNPDVTVRSRGVMEKCTFCTQRIASAKDQAKKQGHKVREKDLMTACQQTCPTDAITFGDINNAQNQVTQLQNDARAFRSIEEVNNRPSIAYLTKVRNKPELKTEGHGNGHH